MSGVVVAGSAPLRQALRFFFVVETQISNAAASDSLGNLASERKRPRIWRLQRAHYGQWPAIRAPEQGLSLRPSPIIGVRRTIMQCRAHDDDSRAAPVVALGPGIAMASAFQAPPPEQGVFSGWDVGGLVDSWPKTLVPSASNRSTPEWTLVDSVESRQRRFDEQQPRASGTWPARSPASAACSDPRDPSSP